MPLGGAWGGPLVLALKLGAVAVCGCIPRPMCSKHAHTLGPVEAPPFSHGVDQSTLHMAEFQFCSPFAARFEVWVACVTGATFKRVGTCVSM